MISAKRLAQMAKKWQRMAALARKRVTSPSKGTDAGSSSSSRGASTSAALAGKGRFVAYSADGRRFEVPLAYLGTAVFVELLRVSREEFGFASGGRITLPFDAAAVEYVMRLLGREASEEVGRAFLSSMVRRPCHYYGNDLGVTMGPAAARQTAVSIF